MPVCKTLLLLSLFACLPVAGAGAAVTKTVQAQGQGVVLHGDTSAAFIQAKNQALRQAVEQAVGVLVSARSRVANFSLIEDDIYSRTAGFVRRYDVVQRKLLDRQTYWVELRAEVDLGDLEGHLQASGQLAREIGGPRLFCRGDSTLVQAVAARLRTRLPEVEVRPYAGADLGEKTGTRGDIVINLETNTRILPPAPLPFSRDTISDTGLASVECSSQTFAYWADSGQPIAKIQRTDIVAGASPSSARQRAVEAAADSLAARLLDELAQAWRAILYDGRKISLEVVGEHRALQRFERAFGQGMGSVLRLEPQRIEKNKGAYTAYSRGAAFTVARELSARGVHGFDVEIVAVTANTLQINLAETAVAPAEAGP